MTHGAIDYRERERRIRRARKMAKQLGLRLTNLRSLNGTGSSIWALVEERTFGDVEAELLRRTGQERAGQGAPSEYDRVSYEVWTDHEPRESEEGYTLAQYVTLNVCSLCGAAVHDTSRHDAWHGSNRKSDQARDRVVDHRTPSVKKPKPETVHPIDPQTTKPGLSLVNPPPEVKDE